MDNEGELLAVLTSSKINIRFDAKPCCIDVLYYFSSVTSIKQKEPRAAGQSTTIMDFEVSPKCWTNQLERLASF